MRLERLEISGFKSFSDRSELAFDEGVTAIVGPNGCGKSNVADAITWVLGEQSAKSLRGDKMEDVIFNGSDARRPGGTAEVRLRLAGVAAPAREMAIEAEAPPESIEDLAQRFTRDVEVTRRLYRSGESEYLIDGEICRLRDVHELLMDTGLGAKAYSIIEQGKIGMILSSRPADRRHLIEEAAGITKYKARRRAAELKLEAAQQNLTRIDDIVFEVEKQRGALKRQAAKARRYQRLRDELRRWEMVLFARRYRELADAIAVAQAAIAETREREGAAAARLAEVESDLARLRIEQAEADGRASAIREDAHARELDIAKRQQQRAFDIQQTEMLAARAQEIAQELSDLDSRRAPSALAVEEAGVAAQEAATARDDAAGQLTAATEAHDVAARRIEALEGDVETARARQFAVLNNATALRHALEHAGQQQARVGEALSRLEVEHDDLCRERERVQGERTQAVESLERARGALEQLRVTRAAREAELSAVRVDHERVTREIRSREHAVASLAARLASLEELAGTRAEFSDAARMVLVQANGHVGQQGAVADYLEVDGRYERAVEACLGDLLQHVIVERHEQAAAGLSLVREQDAGRCGFVVVDPESNGYHPREVLRRPGIVPVSDVLRIQGPHVTTIGKVVPEAYIADSFEQAVAFSRETSAPVATLTGDVFRGPHLVTGGAKVESRGILTTRREIKELRDRLGHEREELGHEARRLAEIEAVIAATSSAITTLQEQWHASQVAIVSGEGQVSRAEGELERLRRRGELITGDRVRADDERAALEARRAEAQRSLERLGGEQSEADEALAQAQRRLADARADAAALSGAAADARARHATLVERASAAAADVRRFESAVRELEHRIAVRTGELEQSRVRRETLLQAIDEAARSLDADVATLTGLRETLRDADEVAAALRASAEAQDAVIREARRGLEQVRAAAAELDVRLATAESNRAHLAQSCVESVQASIEDVLTTVAGLEAAGQDTPDAATIAAEEPDPEAEDGEMHATAPAAAVPASMTAEEAITRLRAKIDRLGPVNMIAIEQFDELEQRHAFLTVQRADLIESIRQTSEAIARIDETSRTRFAEAFAAIQQNFQHTFTTLFGGGRAGLSLLDENDPLETGIDIVASPPGKRLQSVQLLSGGEKALTAIALMFAIFQYKPSPFCLLDEIDAPLDDANVSRFVEMLKGMLAHTQFILITHNRRTMEIADRLYGVTMEEPGVSKLISLQLH